MTIGIVGLGVMGASYARRLSEKGYRLYGVDQSDEHHAFVVAKGWIEPDKTLPFSSLDGLIICLPIEGYISWMKAHESELSNLTLITDICGLKQPIASFITKHKNIVSHHPMTGSSLQGPTHAELVDFHNQPVFMVDEFADISAINTLKIILNDCGFAPAQSISIEDHDHWITFSSHGPHILAALLFQLTLSTPIHTPGRSLQTMIRYASMNPQLWSSLFLLNKEAIYPLLSSLKEQIQNFEFALQSPALMKDWFDTLHSHPLLRDLK